MLSSPYKVWLWPGCELMLLLVAVAVVLSRVLDATTVVTPKLGEMNAHFINVGQGASVLLLEFSCGVALFDTGGRPQTARRYLPPISINSSRAGRICRRRLRWYRAGAFEVKDL
jgi:beta-lactamase superfamily II metal-dependent hydrolase